MIYLNMRLITAFCFVILIWMPVTVGATVYEFSSDGTITSHEAVDYLSKRKTPPAKTKVSLPTIEKKQYSAIIKAAAKEYDISSALVHAVILQESAYNPNALSNKGAMGLMQLMPQTAKFYKVKNAFDPKENILAGTKLLSTLLRKYNHNTARALAAYNAGEGAVSKYNGIPPYPETQQYVRKILLRLR